MDRSTAKIRLSALRSLITDQEIRLKRLVDEYMDGKYSDEEVTALEAQLKASLKIANDEFKQISSLPCCNI